MAAQVSRAPTATPTRPCPRCPHRLSDFWTHVNVAELVPSQAHERPAYTSDLIQTHSRNRKPGSEDVLNNELPSHEAESSLNSIETNSSTEMPVVDTPAELHAGHDPKDQQALNSPLDDGESNSTDCSHEELDEFWAMSSIPGAPTPFNSPRIRTSKAPTLNMEELLDRLNI